MYFFALSQAPPPLFRKRAINIPVDVENIKNAPTTLAPRSSLFYQLPRYLKTTPTTKGERTARSPGLIISLKPALATISTQIL